MKPNMPEKHLFEYAVIRVVPRIEREEFLNAGVVVYCRNQAFLQMLFTLDEARFNSLFPPIDMEEIRLHLHAFEKICQGNPQAGPIAKLEITSRFRWLTAQRSTVIQTSAVHPGLCLNARETLERLYQQLVMI
jgi:hypothetical protein